MMFSASNRRSTDRHCRWSRAGDGGKRDENIAQARELLEVAASTDTDPEDEAAADDATGSALATPCPCCGGRMIVIDTFEAGGQPLHAPTIRIDTS